MNKRYKQKELRNYLTNKKIRLAGLIEARIKKHNSLKIRKKIVPNLEMFTNYQTAANGRLWKALWDNLRGATVGINKPWLVVGDFNAVMCQDDRLFSNSITYTEIKEYSACMHEFLITEIQWRGDYYTWSNKQLGSDIIYSRLDRAFGNHEWMMERGHLIMEYDVPFISDHAPMLLTLASSSSNIKVPFKSFNVWANHEEFLKIVEEIWQQSHSIVKVKNI
ncbi:uncharacterized protein [Nicotiana tomentosiformis]|uniref:uncharacterized protein n=1 Tax=Nicotiana tomentosiformis TaxID=4098 RepID=UPI00388CDE28